MSLSELRAALEEYDDSCEPAVDVRLHRAALAADVRRLVDLLPDADAAASGTVNAPLRLLGLTPLRLAVTGGAVECVACLLDRGAEVDAVDVKGQTPLFVAVRDEQLECLKVLLERGAAPDGSPLHLLSPLGQCCQAGWLPGLQLLLAAGADPEAALVRAAGRRAGPLPPALPLYTAVVYQHLDCALALLLAGGLADPARRPGVSPQLVSRVSLPHAVLKHRCAAQFLEVLHEFGANLWQRDERGRPAWQSHPDAPLAARVQLLAGRPRSLRSLCRLAVRGALGRRALRRVPELPVPPALARYLLHGDALLLPPPPPPAGAH